MLSKKEYGTLGFLYFGNLSQAKEFGFNSLDEIVLEVERMKAIGVYLNNFGYNPKHSFIQTPPSYRKAWRFLESLQTKYPKEVAMFVKKQKKRDFLGVTYIMVSPINSEGFVLKFYGCDLDMFEVLKAIEEKVNLTDGDLFTIGFIENVITYIIRNGEACKTY